MTIEPYTAVGVVPQIRAIHRRSEIAVKMRGASYGDRAALLANINELIADHRARLAFYKDDAPYKAGTLTPEPEILIPSKGDGSIAHLQNWLDCIRSRQRPNAHIRVAHQAARTGHIANASLRAGKVVRWNSDQERLES